MKKFDQEARSKILRRGQALREAEVWCAAMSSNAGIHLNVESDPTGWVRVASMLDGGQLSYTAQVGDRIRSINGLEVHGMNEADVDFLLEGQEGTVVKIELLRAKEPQEEVDLEVTSRSVSVVWSPFTVTVHRCSNATQDIQIALMKEVTKLCQDELEKADSAGQEVELAIGTSAFTFGRLESRFFNEMRKSIRENSLKREAMTESSIYSSQLDSSRLESSRSHQTVVALRQDLQNSVSENGRLAESLVHLRKAMQARDALHTEALRLVVSLDPALTNSAEGEAKVRAVLEHGLAGEIGFSVRRLQVIYLHARVDSVSTHDVLINIHPPFNSRYDPMMDHVVDEPAALEAAQDILERIANDTLDLHSAQVRIVSGQRVDQEEYLALLRKTVEQFSSPMKASSMDAKSEFYAVEELTKTRTALRDAIERATMLDELNAALTRQLRSKELRVEELEVEKAKLEQGLHFRKMASIREQADHEQRLQEVQDEKDGRIRELQEQLVKIDQRLKVQEIMAGEPETPMQKRAREGPHLPSFRDRDARHLSGNTSTMPPATPWSIRSEESASVDAADLEADWIKDEESGARWVLDPSSEGQDGANARRRNSYSSRRANPSIPGSPADSNFSFASQIPAMDVVPVHRASSAQRTPGNPTVGQVALAAGSSEEDEGKASPLSHHSIPHSRASSVHSLPQASIPAKQLAISEHETEISSAVDSLKENMDKLKAEDPPF